MASVIDVEDLTLNPKEAQEISEISFDIIWNDESLLTKVHDIITGIKMKEQIVFGSDLGDSLKVLKGCKPDTAKGFELSEKFWNPEIFAARWEHCQRDVDRLFKMWQNFDKINPDFFELSTEEMAVIVMAIMNSLPTNILTIVWFADTEAEHIADGGAFSAGVDLDLYNGIDGLWRQIFDEIPTTAANYVAIAKNNGANYAAQVLTPVEVYAVLNSMYFKADRRLRVNDGAGGLTGGDVFYLVTDGIYDGYLQYLSTTQQTGAGNTMIVENGQTVLRFFGIEVVNMTVWSRKIQELQNDGTKLNLPNRAVLTSKYNIPIGTTSEEDFDKVTSKFDDYENINFMDVYMNLDAKLLRASAMVAAY